MQPPPSAPPPPPPAPYPPSGYPQPFGYMQPFGYAAPPRRRTRRWWIFGCGGCAVLALLLLGIGISVAVHTFTSSPLRQFPTEPGAVTTQDNFQWTNNQSSETVLITDQHVLADAETFYRSALNENGWNVNAGDPAQAASGDAWTFGRDAAPSQGGSIQFVTDGANTTITVRYHF